jgi:hypothetical protein
MTQQENDFADDYFERLAQKHTNNNIKVTLPEIDEERIIWEIKGDKEIYIEKLEARLQVVKANYQPPVPPEVKTKNFDDPQDVPLINSSEEQSEMESLDGVVIERGMHKRLYDVKSGEVLGKDGVSDNDDEADSVVSEEEFNDDREEENKYVPISTEHLFEHFEDENEAIDNVPLETIRNEFPDDDFEVSFPDQDDDQQSTQNKLIVQTMSSFTLNAPSWVKDEDISSLIKRIKNK